MKSYSIIDALVDICHLRAQNINYHSLTITNLASTSTVDGNALEAGSHDQPPPIEKQ